MARDCVQPFGWTVLLAWAAVVCACEQTPRPADAPKDAERAASPDARSPAGDADRRQRPLRVELFSRTTGYRHRSIEPARRALIAALAPGQHSVHSGEDAAELTERLAQVDVVVFLMTTGDVLDDAQQARFETFVREGGGFVGVHSAADTEYDWPFYGELVGARFGDHPEVQSARIVVEDATHPATSFLPSPWQREDEWYNFSANPRANVQVLLTLDESSYSGGNMGSDHPLAWCRSLDRGRSFYTAVGHTDASWAEPQLVEHVYQAILWAAGPGTSD